MSKRYVAFDIESHSAGKQYGMAPRDFFRLGQYAINDGPVVLEEDYDAFMAVLESADYLIGHNISSFDLPVLYGVDSMRPLELALQRKVIDTYVLASLVTPAPYSYTDKKGHTFFDAAKPERAMRYLGLDNLAFQFGLPGKLGDLSEIAARYNPPKTPKKDLDYGLIDIQDPEYREYAEGDVIAVRALCKYLIDKVKTTRYDGEYIWREMIVWAINARISNNGVTVDVEAAQKRVDELAEERDRIMAWLVEEFDMPTDTKMPWKSKAGKEAILKALESYGITPDDNPAWTRTASGAPSFSGDTMVAVTEGTEAEELGRALATLQGQRSLAQLALESVYEDGKAHPSILCLQRSGRTSVTKPGLTVWTARGPGAVEKRYMIADPGHYMVEMDYNAADARAVAAVSGDEEFVKRFEPGVDAHDLTGEIFFGKDAYYADRDRLRPIAKLGGHAMAYRVGAKKLAASVGVSVEEAKGFIDAYRKAYPFVAYWQDKVTEEGDRGYVTNAWGRRMTVDPDRSFNQSSALIGQSSTRDVLYSGLIRIAYDRPEVLRWFRMLVHDAIVLSIPEEDMDWGVPYVMEKMQMTFDPKTNMSQPVDFPMAHGPLDARDWWSAGH